MRRPVIALAVSAGLLLGLVAAPPATASDHYGDPYRPGPLVQDLWCQIDPASVVLDYVEDSAIGDAIWAVVEFFTDYEKPPGGAFTPEMIYPAGCDRAKIYKAERMKRGDLLNQTGDDAQLWQNRGFPALLNSAEDPPDFVVVGMGDSFASGEGNPANGIDWLTELVVPYAFMRVEWTDFTDYSIARSESDDPDAAQFCHRSSKSGFASAMMEMRRLYPQFNIYWRNFACSGAETRHLWRDPYVTWKFFQSQIEAGVLPSTVDQTAFLKVAQSDATQAPQISQATKWLKTFPKAPKVDATYMSVGGNDVFFGPVIGECTFSCSAGKEWTDLSQVAIKGGPTPPTVLKTAMKCNVPFYTFDACTKYGGTLIGIPAAEVIDPLAPTCTITKTAASGCLSRQPLQTWSSSAARYVELNKQIQSNLKPSRTYLAEVPDFTHSDNGKEFCADSNPPISAYGQGVVFDDDAYMVKHDPYARMDSDFLLSFSEWDSWKYAQEKVGTQLVNEIRKVATDDGKGTIPNWYLVSRGPKGDRLWDGWQDKHGMCALRPYVNTLSEATDMQGEDMDALLDVSAGILHPNAFGQQDYAERILYSMVGQLREKMTPKLIVGSAAWRAAAMGGWLTLGGNDGTTVNISIPWSDLNYPNGNDRAWVQVRTTPITLDIKRVGLQFLQRPDSFTYRLDFTRQSEEEVSGDEALSTGRFGTSISLSPEDAGVAVEIRACGPRAYDGDYRTCGKWQGVGSYTRPPVDVYDPDAYAELRRLERRLSDATFATRLKQVLTKVGAAKTTPIRVGNTTVKVPFGWGKAIPLLPLAARENATPVVENTAGVDPTWSADEPVLADRPDLDSVIACGVPDDVAEQVLDALLSSRRISLSEEGVKLVACLEDGDPAVEFPQTPQFGDSILENQCDGATQSQVDRIEELMGDDTAPVRGVKDDEPEVFALVECLHRNGVPWLEQRERAAQAELDACSLTMLDWPLLQSRYSPSPAARDAIECLRSNQGLPPVYWFERRTGSP